MALNVTIVILTVLFMGIAGLGIYIARQIIADSKQP